MPDLVLATTTEWLGFAVMHGACAEVRADTVIAGKVVRPLGQLLRIRCIWCQYPLAEPADPEIERTLVGPLG